MQHNTLCHGENITPLMDLHETTAVANAITG